MFKQDVCQEHVCEKKDDWCLSKILSDKARAEIERIKTKANEPDIDRLEQTYLVCKECEHKGVFSHPIIGPPPGIKGAENYSCSYAMDFAICPKCGHWTIIKNPFNVKRGARI